MQQGEHGGDHAPVVGALAASADAGNEHAGNERADGDQSVLTARLLLRRLTVDDAAAYLPLVALPQVLRFLDETAVPSVEAARRILIDYPLADYARYGYGRMACIERSSGRLVGFCGLKFLPGQGEVDIGFRFLPTAWGQGYATESAAALMAHGRRQHGIGRIIGLVDPANRGSARVLVKLGLRLERRLCDGPWRHDLYASPAPPPAAAGAPV